MSRFSHLQSAYPKALQSRKLCHLTHLLTNTKIIFDEGYVLKKILCEKNFYWIFNILATLVFGVLFYHCLGKTGENDYVYEFIHVNNDSVVLNGLLLFLSIVVLYFIGKISSRITTERRRNIILFTACLLSAVFSFYWVVASNTKPVADQMMICQYANAFNMDDFHGFDKGQYLARYSQQLGMVTLLRLIFAIFGESNYRAFQYLCAAMVPLLVLSGCMIVRILTEDNIKAEIYYFIFILTCFPMYAYTTFVYGDLISTILGVFSIWMYLSCMKHFSWLRLGLFAVSIGMGVALRKNLLILVVAIGIVTLIKLIFARSIKSLIILAALVVGVAGIHTLLWESYRNVNSGEGREIPASLYIVMGLNDDYGRAGWHNAYEYAVFNEVGDDVKKANEKAFEDLKMYLEIYKNDPDYMIDFFVRKMVNQWISPMYQSIAMNNEAAGGQLQPVKNIFAGGKLAKIIEVQMKAFQLLLYGSIFFLLIIRRRDYNSIESYVLLIAVFGGFLFSLMWEAKTRYVMPYLFMQIPYMAIGVNEFTDFWNRIHKREDNL